MNNAIYNEAKKLLISEAKEIKRINTNDKPYQRYELNNSLDRILNDLQRQTMKDTITEKQYNLYAYWLTNTTIKFHPKN